MDAGARTEAYGSDLRLEVWGPDLAACADAALRAFAEHVADVPAAAPRQRREIELEAADPPGLLVELVDEAIARIDIDGELACGFDGAVDERSPRLAGGLLTVDLGSLALLGAPPKAATWHRAHLEREGRRWHGTVLLDL